MGDDSAADDKSKRLLKGCLLRYQINLHRIYEDKIVYKFLLSNLVYLCLLVERILMSKQDEEHDAMTVWKQHEECDPLTLQENQTEAHVSERELEETNMEELVNELRLTAPIGAINPFFKDRLLTSLLQNFSEQFSSHAYYTYLNTSLGKVYLAYRGEKVQFVVLGEERMFLQKAGALLKVALVYDADPPSRMIQMVRETIEEQIPYEGDIDVSYLTEFQQRILEVIKRMPPGEVWTYKQVAKAVSSPRSAHMVSRFLKWNPVALLIPSDCVVSSKRKLLQKFLVSYKGEDSSASAVDVEFSKEYLRFLLSLLLVVLRDYIRLVIRRYYYLDTEEIFRGIDCVEMDAVYVPLRIKAGGACEHDIKRGQEQIFLSLEKVIEGQTCVVLCGRSGSGKTTMLRHFALKAAQTFERGGGHMLPLPIRVSEYVLGGLAERKSLIDFLVDRFSFQSSKDDFKCFLFIKLLLGECVVLIDGMSELDDKQDRQWVQREVNRFVACYPENRLVVTLRSQEEGAFLSSAFGRYTVQGFGKLEVSSYLEKWCSLMETKPFETRHSMLRESTTVAGCEAISQSLELPREKNYSTNDDDLFAPLLLQISVIVYYVLIRHSRRGLRLQKLVMSILLSSELSQDPSFSSVFRDEYLTALLSRLAYWRYLEQRVGSAMDMANMSRNMPACLENVEGTKEWGWRQKEAFQGSFEERIYLMLHKIWDCLTQKPSPVDAFDQKNAADVRELVAMVERYVCSSISVLDGRQTASSL